MSITNRTARAGMAAAGMMLGVLATALVAPAHAKELSDKSVVVLMNYAWTIMPQKFTTPGGEVIEVDKSKKDQIVVPLDVARQVIQVGRITAIAQTCRMPEEAAENYRALMYGEKSKRRWSKQQELYINQLHLFTVMWLTGKVKLIEKEGEKDVVISEGKDIKTQSCTEAEQKQVKETITAFAKQMEQVVDANDAKHGSKTGPAPGKNEPAKKAEAPPKK